MSALIRPRLRRSMTFAATVRRRIQQFGTYRSLAILLVPLLIVEPIKMADPDECDTGHWAGGASMIVGAYAAGILVVDRLYRVVKSKLYTIGWCATLAQIVQTKLARTRMALR